MSYVIQDIWKWTTVEPLRRALLGPRLCCVVSCPIGWVFHGVPVWWFGNGREKVKCIDEWESVWVYLWRNGFSSVWTHILFCFSFWRSQSTLNLKNFYSSMSVCPLFLNSEHMDTQSMKKTKKKSTGPRNKWKDKINVHFYNKHSDQSNTNLYGTNHTSQYDKFTPQGNNRKYQLYVFLERD